MIGSIAYGLHWVYRVHRLYRVYRAYRVYRVYWVGFIGCIASTGFTGCISCWVLGALRPNIRVLGPSAYINALLAAVLHVH